MASCPVCQAEIEITSQHYGTLYTCPSCNAVFFVDWAGDPEKSMPQREDEVPLEPLDLEGEVDSPSPSFESTFSEITDFGNADVTQAAFNYTVTISGIDTAVIYQQVKEAVADSKFGWNVIQVMTQIKDGVLILTSLNAVKASILVQRVKYLPVKVSWSQDVLSSQI